MTRPVPLGDPRTHFWLIVGMADAVGADLPEAFAEGRIDNAEWARMVDSCCGCAQPCACQEFLAATPEANEPPDFCENRDRLTMLATA